jgi:hypothetical protein
MPTTMKYTCALPTDSKTDSNLLQAAHRGYGGANSNGIRNSLDPLSGVRSLNTPIRIRVDPTESVAGKVDLCDSHTLMSTNPLISSNYFNYF